MATVYMPGNTIYILYLIDVFAVDAPNCKSVPVAVEMLGYIYGINKYPSSLRGEVISDYIDLKSAGQSWLACIHLYILYIVYFRLGLHTQL